MQIEDLLKQPPIARRALFVDMNSFFASVEQQIKPELRGKPVGVCPFINDSTSVIAASIEAKRFGVKTGVGVGEAKRRCPEIILISDDPSVYRDYHRRIMQALDQTRCQVSIRSIDEAYLSVPRDLRAGALDLAYEIKQRIHRVGDQLHCSVGIASNLFLAKMATKVQKPDGLVEIRPDDLPAFYETLALTDLTGISWRMSRRLQAIGIRTATEFYAAPFQRLKEAFGVNGARWYLRLHGYEVDLQPTRRRMIGHQTTIVPNPATTAEQVLSVASQLCYKAAARLRAAELAAQSVHLAVRFSDRSYWGKTLRTHSPFWDSATFYSHVEQMLADWRPLKPVRLVSVSAIDLIRQADTTLPLFEEPTRNQALSRALDQIEQTWGRRTILPAAQLLSGQVTDRVGFGNAHHMAERHSGVPAAPKP